MIIKLRTQINGQNSWSIFSNIKSIDWWELKKEQRQGENFRPDTYIQALDKNDRVDETLFPFVWVTAIKEDNTILTFCSNMVIYLLNDEGKTIERIN
jgi:hypothetical protein